MACGARARGAPGRIWTDRDMEPREKEGMRFFIGIPFYSGGRAGGCKVFGKKCSGPVRTQERSFDCKYMDGKTSSYDGFFSTWVVSVRVVDSDNRATAPEKKSFRYNP
jgi:hypothetical protein